jgi:DNA-directed RNA polymerase specialized sigma24 family protein
MGNCDHEMSDRKFKFHLEFDREFQTLLVPGSSTGCAMLALIERSLRQFNLQNSHSAAEILIEAYVRGRKRIDSGEQIYNPNAWTKTTALNVIREYSRKQKQTVQTENYQFDEHLNTSSAPFEDFSREYKLMTIAFSHLTREEQELLTLKVIKQLSWRAISDYLSQKYDKDLKEDTLRKRKERALKRLHQIYHSLKPKSD